MEEDPPVWFYTEGMKENEPILEGKFTDVLLKDMRGLASIIAR